MSRVKLEALLAKALLYIDALERDGLWVRPDEDDE